MVAKRQFNMRILERTYQDLQSLSSNQTTRKCPTCGQVTKKNLSTFKDYKITALAAKLLEVVVDDLISNPDKYNIILEGQKNSKDSEDSEDLEGSGSLQ
tara:strand:+ start:234 stop:530 length:297 start_codon:yes stop_codon:yes gene_type:complete